MSYNQYKNIAQVLGDFPLTYQEENFIQENPLEIDDYFRNRFELVLRGKELYLTQSMLFVKELFFLF